jgi:hypothetical protein
MGSWNQTCAVSNLPITAGTEVVTFFTSEVPGNEDPRKYLTPFPFYSEGRYDDYGQVENERGTMLAVIISTLSSRCLPVEAGENQYHENEVVPESFTWDSIMLADRQDRLKSEISVGQKKIITPIKHLQVRRDVFDTIMENHLTCWWKEGSYGDQPTFADIIDDYPVFYRKAKESLESDDILKRWTDPLGNNPDRDNHISLALCDNMYNKSCGVMDARVIIKAAIEMGGTEEQVYPIVENAIQMEVLNSFMQQTHRQWQIPGYAGQEGDTRAHQLLASMIIDIAEARELECDEWNGEEFSDEDYANL